MGFVLECMTEDQRVAEQESIRERLGNIEHTWHASKIAMLSAWYRGLSELQPYLQAERVGVSDNSWVSTKYQFYPAGARTPYYQLMFEMRDLTMSESRA